MRFSRDQRFLNKFNPMAPPDNLDSNNPERKLEFSNYVACVYSGS